MAIRVVGQFEIGQAMQCNDYSELKKQDAIMIGF